ncbi:MAG TPA: hypothetical protein VGQ65_03445 [Thermoanaerobaculia bacterium]|jgi:hypothetical protein|nr:hypothetical protein [Thermoanaerobaculia bacterium]
MTVLLPYVSRLLILAGALCGLCGAAQMANQFTSTVDGWLDLADVLINAIGRGKKAKGMVAVADKSPEQKLTTLQGIAFVFLGFLLQSLGVLLDLLTFH